MSVAHFELGPVELRGTVRGNRGADARTAGEDRLSAVNRRDLDRLSAEPQRIAVCRVDPDGAVGVMNQRPERDREARLQRG